MREQSPRHGSGSGYSPSLGGGDQACGFGRAKGVAIAVVLAPGIRRGRKVALVIRMAVSIAVVNRAIVESRIVVAKVIIILVEEER